jgi:hypothetical protein
VGALSHVAGALLDPEPTMSVVLLVPPVPPSLEVIGLVELLNVPELVPVTTTLIPHADPPPFNVPAPDKVMEVEPDVTPDSVPPQLLDVTDPVN